MFKLSGARITNIVIIALLVLNLLCSTMLLLGGIGKSGASRSLQEELAMAKENMEWSAKIGKDNLRVIDDRISTESYGTKKLLATLVNDNSKETIHSISVKYKFYKKNKFIGTGSDFISELGPDEELGIEVYTVEGFDRYELHEVSGTIYP